MDKIPESSYESLYSWGLDAGDVRAVIEEATRRRPELLIPRTKSSKPSLVLDKCPTLVLSKPRGKLRVVGGVK